MNCRFVQNSLSAYLDHELDAASMTTIRAHLHDCSKCHAEEQELRSLKALLGGLQMPAPRVEFEAQLQLIAQGKVTTRSQSHVGRTVFVFAGIAAASMFITLKFLSAPAGNSTPKVSDGSRRLAFEVQRDQAYNASSDPFGGAAVFSSTPYGP